MDRTSFISVELIEHRLPLGETLWPCYFYFRVEENYGLKKWGHVPQVTWLGMAQLSINFNVFICEIKKRKR